MLVLMLLLVGLLFVAEASSARARADTLVTTVPISGAVEDAVNSQTGLVYVTDSGADSISVLNASTNSIIASISLPSYAAAVAVNPATDTVYATDGGSRLYVIDGATEQLTDTITLPISGTDSIAVNSQTDTIYVVSLDNQLAVVDGATDKVTTTMSLNNTYATNWVAINPDDGLIYVSAVTRYDGGGTLTMINATTDTLVRQVQFDGSNGYFVVVNPLTNAVYVAGGNATFVFNGSTGALTGTIPQVSVGLGFNSATDKVYITNEEDPGSLFVVNATSLALGQTIALQNGSFDIAIDQSTNVVYVVNEISHSLSVIDGTGTSQLTVSSQDTEGNTITGYYTTLSYDGQEFATGFTPASYTVEDGQTYVVQADSYDNCTFNHWENTESTSAQQTITIAGNTHVVAIYNCVGSGSSVTVNSVNQNGVAITGYYTILYNSGGSPTAIGFTPATFTTTAGLSYSIAADSYASCTFSRWSDGSTSDPRSFSATSGTTSFTAVYQCGDASSPTIEISTVNSMGATITGYYISLWQGATKIASCFSACTFTVNPGQTYQIEAASYGNETFSHWQNDRATGRETVNVPDSSATISLTAIYSP